MGICLVMKNNFRRSLHHKIRWIIILVMPFLLSLLTIVINQIQEDNYRVGVILSKESIKSNDENNYMQELCYKLNQMDKIEAKVANIQSYHTDLLMGTYHYVIDCSNEENVTIISNKPQEDNEEFYNMIMNGMPKEQVPELNNQDQNLLRMQQSIGFLMSLFLILSVVQGGMYIRDKNHGIITRYCFAPTTRIRYMFGNLCFIFSITFLQVVACYILLCVVNATWLSLTVSIKIILMISFVASLFAFLLCMICKNDTQASISASAITSIFTIISGTFVSIESMPYLLKVLSSFSPIRWCMELISR